MLTNKKQKTKFEDSNELSGDSLYEIAKTKTKPRINFEAGITEESNSDEESDESEENLTDFERMTSKDDKARDYDSDDYEKEEESDGT
jgi:hypothetical protein